MTTTHPAFTFFYGVTPKTEFSLIHRPPYPNTLPEIAEIQPALYQRLSQNLAAMFEERQRRLSIFIYTINGSQINNNNKKTFKNKMNNIESFRSRFTKVVCIFSNNWSKYDQPLNEVHI